MNDKNIREYNHLMHRLGFWKKTVGVLSFFTAAFISCLAIYLFFF